MPGLFKRSNGIYYLHFINSSGRRSWKSTGKRSKSDALDFLRTFSPSKKITATLPKDLSDLIAKNYARIYRPRNLNLYRISLDILSKKLPGVSLSGISRLNIQDLIRELLQEIKPISVNKHLRTLRSAFNHALRWGLIETNPFSRFPLLKIPESAPIFFLPGEIALIISDMRSKGFNTEADIASIALHTGLRRGEILSLHWDDIDLHRGIIRIKSSEGYQIKGGKMRSVPLNLRGEEIIKKYPRREDRSTIFPGIHPDTLSKRFKRSIRDCNLGEDLHFHSLRHTFASWLVQRGTSLYIVQRLLGHSSPSMTQIYSHLAPEDLRSYVGLIEN